MPKHNSVIMAFNISPTSCFAESQTTEKKQRLSQTQIFPPLSPAQDSNFLKQIAIKTDKYSTYLQADLK